MSAETAVKTKPVVLDLNDDKSFKITVDGSHRFAYYFLGAVRTFPEQKWHADGYWTVPGTEPNVQHFRSKFKPDDVEITADAALFLEYLETTVSLAKLRETRRWKYLFDDPSLKITKTPVDDAVKVVIGDATSGFREYLLYKSPYDHQAVALDAGHEQEFFAQFMEMGTGKTKVVIDEIALCAQDKGCDYKVLVVCPKTIVGTWKNELRKWLSPQLTTYVKRMSSGEKGIDQLMRMIQNIALIKVGIVNYERLGDLKEAIGVMEFDLIIVDESQAIKSGSAQRTKTLVEIGPTAKRRIILTGTPVANSLMDLYWQFEFLSPGSLGYSTEYAFEHAFANIKKVRNWTEITGYKNLDELKERVARHAFVVTKDQCLDLPPKVYETRVVDMGKQQRRMYSEMVDWFLAQMEMEAGDTGVVEARAAIAKIMRLRQITQGFFRNTNGEGETQGDYIAIPDGEGKLQALLEIIEDIGAEQKILVWAPFKFDIHRIEKALKERGVACATLCGDTPQRDRDTVEERFNNSDLRVLIGEAGTGGLGLTLIGRKEMPCSTVVYYGNDYSLIKRQQSEDRAHRIGQTRSVTYIDLVCSESIDEEIAERLQEKKELSDAMKDMGSIRELLLGYKQNGDN